MTRRNGLILAVVVAALVVVADQAAKGWAQASLPRGRVVTAISGWLWFRLASNSGATLGLFAGHNQLVGLLSLLVVVAVVVVLVRGQVGGMAGAGALGAIAGGAISNLIDRVRLGAVTDFIEVHLWPTDFNLADAAVRIGVVVFIVALVWELARGRRAPAG